MTTHLALTTDIAGVSVSREAVLAWEADRARRVLRLLDGHRADVDGSADDLRERLLNRKLALGSDALEAHLARRIRLASGFHAFSCRE